MKRFKQWMVTTGVMSVVVTLASIGVAEAKLAANHNETVLRDRG